MILGNTIRENISDYTVIDIETTGKYINSCEIIELSALKVRNTCMITSFIQKPVGIEKTLRQEISFIKTSLD